MFYYNIFTQFLSLVLFSSGDFFTKLNLNRLSRHQVAYGSLISIFTVKHHDWTTQQGALVTAVFWGSFAFGRFSAIILTRFMSPAVMLVADIIVSTASLFALAMADRFTKDVATTILWTCSATLGVGLASIFPAELSWAERYIKMTSFATSMFVVGSALGEMVLPGLCGVLLDKYHPMQLMYVLFGCALANATLYIGLAVIACQAGERYQSGPAGNSVTDDLLPLVRGGGDDDDDDVSGLISRNGGGGVSLDERKKRVTFNTRTSVNGEVMQSAQPKSKCTSKKD